jgi:hypothetical protein
MSGKDSGGGVIIGVIHPPETPGALPLFTILKRGSYEDEYQRPDEECHHGAFVLDERWQTVKCGLCGAKVEPFAALMTFGEWYEKLRAKQSELTWDRIDSLRKTLRAIRDRVALTDEDRREISNAINYTGKETTIENLSALLDRMQGKIDEARSERRAKRRAAR